MSAMKYFLTEGLKNYDNKLLFFPEPFIQIIQLNPSGKVLKKKRTSTISEDNPTKVVDMRCSPSSLVQLHSVSFSQIHSGDDDHDIDEMHVSWEVNLAKLTSHETFSGTLLICQF